MGTHDADKLDAQLRQLQLKLRQERARSLKPQILKDLDFWSHEDLVELYNALVVKLAGYQ